MPNHELMDKIIQKISDEPESLNMSDYFCGTQACIAGHAALLMGAKRAGNGSSMTYESRRLSAADVASEGLGITYAQACNLFTSCALSFEAHAPRTSEEVAARWKKVTSGY